MNRIHFEVQALQNLAVMETRGTTAGQIQSLDYLPGNLFLGAAAARIYTQLTTKDAFTVFHSGKVRFGNGLPLTDSGQMAYPMPQCWHHPKDQSPLGEDGMLQTEKIINRLQEREPTSQPHANQLRAMRSGYVTQDGTFVKPQVDLYMRTAINPRTGLAAEGQLFGYFSIRQGTRFGFHINADQDVAEALLEKVAQALCGKLRLGRSRSAEYGLADCQRTDPRAAPASSPPGKQLVLWCLSDLAVLDELGQPATLPQPQALGLPPGRFNLAKSFLGHRLVSLMNAKYGHYEPERQIINPGSVLTFDLDKPLPEDWAQKAMHQRIGLYRQQGYGWVWVNPPLLCAEHPKFAEANCNSKEKGKTVQPAAPQVTLLGEWLKSLEDRRDKQNTVEKAAKAWVEELVQCYLDAKLFSQRGQHLLGPSPSQWGRVMTAAKQALRSREYNLGQALFGEDGICRDGDPDWGTRLLVDKDQRRDGSLPTFRTWLQNKMASSETHKEVLAVFARQAMDHARQLKNQSDEEVAS